MDESYLDHFFDNNIKLKTIRTRALNKELKSCDCTASIELNLKTELIKYLLEKANNGELNLSKDKIEELINQKFDSNYNAQETNEGEIIVKSIMPDEIGDLLATSFQFEEFYKNSNIKLKKDKVYRFETSIENGFY